MGSGFLFELKLYTGFYMVIYITFIDIYSDI